VASNLPVSNSGHVDSKVTSRIVRLVYCPPSNFTTPQKANLSPEMHEINLEMYQKALTQMQMPYLHELVTQCGPASPEENRYSCSNAI